MAKHSERYADVSRCAVPAPSDPSRSVQTPLHSLSLWAASRRGPVAAEERTASHRTGKGCAECQCGMTHQRTSMFNSEPSCWASCTIGSRYITLVELQVATKCTPYTASWIGEHAVSRRTMMDRGPNTSRDSICSHAPACEHNTSRFPGLLPGQSCRALSQTQQQPQQPQQLQQDQWCTILRTVRGDPAPTHTILV